MKGLTLPLDWGELTQREFKRCLQRVDSTLSAANGIDGKGMILSVIWGVNGREGVAVRQLQYGMDGVYFRLVDGGVKFLGKVRVILP